MTPTIRGCCRNHPWQVLFPMSLSDASQPSRLLDLHNQIPYSNILSSILREIPLELSGNISILPAFFLLVVGHMNSNHTILKILFVDTIEMLI